MQVKPSEHLARPLMIHALAADFDLLDVWRLPVATKASDGPNEPDFKQFLRAFPLLQPRSGRSAPWQVRALTGVRGLLGRIFGWDDDTKTLPIPGCNEHSLRERLNTAQRERYELAAGSREFKAVYGCDDERVYELSNATVHALLHLSWVAEDAGHRAFMAVYSKPRGMVGRGYMALIAPFRHLIVYPALMKMIERAWQRQRAQATA